MKQLVRSLLHDSEHTFDFFSRGGPRSVFSKASKIFAIWRLRLLALEEAEAEGAAFVVFTMVAVDLVCAIACVGFALLELEETEAEGAAFVVFAMVAVDLVCAVACVGFAPTHAATF